MRYFFLVVIFFSIGLPVYAQTEIVDVDTGTVLCEINDLNFGHAKQTFRNSDWNYQLGKVSLLLKRSGIGSFVNDATLFVTNVGETIIYGQRTLETDDLTTDYEWYEFDFSDDQIHLVHDVVYELFFSLDGVEFVRRINWQYTVFTDPYENGHATCQLTGFEGAGDFNTLITAFAIRPDWYFELGINSAMASTTCNFVTINNTTTAECSDPLVTNSTQDVFSGLVLLFITFFGVLYYFKERR